MPDVYFKSLRVHEYIKYRDKIPGFNDLLKAIAKCFHKHAVDIDDIDMTLNVIGEYLHAEYNGLGDAFDTAKTAKH